MLYLIRFNVKLDVYADKMVMVNMRPTKNWDLWAETACTKMMQHYGVKLIGKLKACDGCMQAKESQ